MTATAEKKATLLELSQELVELDALLEESEGEVTPAIQERLERLQPALASKIDGVGWWWRVLEADAEKFKKVADEMAAKRRTAERKLEGLKAYLKACLEVAGTPKLKGQYYTLSLQVNSSRSVKLADPFVAHPEWLPERFQKVTITPRLEVIKAELEAGGGIIPPGSELAGPVGELLPPGTHVRLR
jgi:hypothetical protein